MDTFEPGCSPETLMRTFERFKARSQAKSIAAEGSQIYTHPPGKNFIETRKSGWIDACWRINQHGRVILQRDFQDALRTVKSIEKIRAFDFADKVALDNLFTLPYLRGYFKTASAVRSMEELYFHLMPNPDAFRQYVEMRSVEDWDNLLFRQTVDITKLEPFRIPLAHFNPFPRQESAVELAAILVRRGRRREYKQMVSAGIVGARFDAAAIRRIDFMSHSVYIRQTTREFEAWLKVLSLEQKLMEILKYVNENCTY